MRFLVVIGPTLPLHQTDFLGTIDFCRRTVSTIWHTMEVATMMSIFYFAVDDGDGGGSDVKVGTIWLA